MTTLRMRASSGNVFRDLGFDLEEAQNLKIRSGLMIQLRQFIDERALTQNQAAKLFSVTQPRISDLVRGKINLFSVDTLMAMLTRTGAQVSIVVRRKARVA